MGGLATSHLGLGMSDLQKALREGPAMGVPHNGWILMVLFMGHPLNIGKKHGMIWYPHDLGQPAFIEFSW